MYGLPQHIENLVCALLGNQKSQKSPLMTLNSFCNILTHSHSEFLKKV